MALLPYITTYGNFASDLDLMAKPGISHARIFAKETSTLFPLPILDNNRALWYDLSVMIDQVDNNEAHSEVYILHFDRSYWSAARHYIGYTTVGTENRVRKHRNGTGSLLVNYAHNKKGINFVVGMVEEFVSKPLARWREKQLKKEGHLARHCEICQKEVSQ